MSRASLGDTVAVMDDGRIVHSGAMAELAADDGAAGAAARAVAWRRTNDDRHRTAHRARAPIDCDAAAAGAGVALVALPLIGSATTWLTLTVAGLAMGMMIFIMASGLTLVFGLMDVINFGHGAFIAVGAFVGFSVLWPLAGWSRRRSLALNLAALAPAHRSRRWSRPALLGWVFERVIMRPVYG